MDVACQGKRLQRSFFVFFMLHAIQDWEDIVCVNHEENDHKGINKIVTKGQQLRGWCTITWYSKSVH